MNSQNINKWKWKMTEFILTGLFQIGQWQKEQKPLDITIKVDITNIEEHSLNTKPYPS